MTRVAHVMAGARNGGAELFYERLTTALAAAGDAVLPVIRGDPDRLARLIAAGLAPVGLRFGAHLDWRTPRLLREALHGFRPQVVVSWMSRATRATPRGPWTLVGRLGGYYDLRHYRHCDRLIGNTRGIVAWLRHQGWPVDRTSYLPNFVEDLHGHPPATDLADGRPWILALGRLHRDKAFDILIPAMRSVPGARLAIAGEGPERASLERLARRAGVADRVRFLGWRTDVGALLGAARLFVSSSRVEPLGNMVLEAWSAGCPVIAAAADGPAELIEQEVTGLLCPREDPGALGAAMAALLGDGVRAARLAAAGRLRFQTDFARQPVLAVWQTALNGWSG